MGHVNGLKKALSVPLEPATSRSQECGIQGTSRDDAISISSGDENSDDSVADFSPLPDDSIALVKSVASATKASRLSSSSGGAL
jgi:hypothetical protein